MTLLYDAVHSICAIIAPCWNPTQFATQQIAPIFFNRRGQAMIIDLRKIENLINLDADVCVIGAGAAGIAIALEFIKTTNLAVVLLEGGGETSDPATQSLYAGQQSGLIYDKLEASRSRFLGGSTNCWGGWCRPLDLLDFQERDWVPGSGWPFDRDELLPYYEESHSLLKLKPFNYDLAAWTSLLEEKTLAPLPIKGSRLANMIVHLSEPARFGQLYRQQLNQATNVKLMLFANATEICTDDQARQRLKSRSPRSTERNFPFPPKSSYWLRAELRMRGCFCFRAGRKQKASAMAAILLADTSWITRGSGRAACGSRIRGNSDDSMIPTWR